MPPLVRIFHRLFFVSGRVTGDDLTPHQESIAAESRRAGIDPEQLVWCVTRHGPDAVLVVGAWIEGAVRPVDNV